MTFLLLAVACVLSFFAGAFYQRTALERLEAAVGKAKGLVKPGKRGRIVSLGMAEAAKKLREGKSLGDL